MNTSFHSSFYLSSGSTADEEYSYQSGRLVKRIALHGIFEHECTLFRKSIVIFCHVENGRYEKIIGTVNNLPSKIFQREEAKREIVLMYVYCSDELFREIERIQMALVESYDSGSPKQFELTADYVKPLPSERRRRRINDILSLIFPGTNEGRLDDPTRNVIEDHFLLGISGLKIRTSERSGPPYRFMLHRSNELRKLERTSVIIAEIEYLEELMLTLVASEA